ncbi:MAG: lyase family protein, partial [Actinomycetota bacterium]
MKLWGGRFQKETEEKVHAFSSSLSFDRRLAHYDIQVSKAHALALEDCGVLSPDERAKITEALNELDEELDSSDLPFGDDEDIHSCVERILVERLGDTGAKLRAGRSRNDQVATDLRLYLRDASAQLAQGLLVLMEALVEQAEAGMGAVMPGFTHLQPAQPVLLSHHLLAYYEMFKRDVERLMEAR